MSDCWGESWDSEFPEYTTETVKVNHKSSVPEKIRFGRGSSTSNSNQQDDRTSQSSMIVDQRMVGVIIGKRGSKIHELQDRSGAKITISTDKNDNGVVVYLGGGESETNEARRMINELINESAHFDLGNRRNNSFKREFQQHEEFEKTLQVPTSICGKIIGRGGSNIRRMQEESGARIDVRHREAVDDMTPVLIKGSSDSVERAEDMINEKIKELDYQQEKPSSSEFGLSSTENESFLDWEALGKAAAKHFEQKWSNLPPIVKKYYREDSFIADLLPHEVEKWRAENFNITVTHLVDEKPHVILNPVLTFEQAFQHFPEILETIRAQGFQKPSPIQSQVWPLAMSGYDVIGIAQTGTGKTLAFLLPILIHIEGQSVPRSKREGPSCLILTPTRELALQIETEVKKYHYRDIRCVCVYGGGDRRKQINLVKGGVEIVVATPGRFNDLLSNDIISLKSATFLVLDEADRMLDMGFEPQIMKIMIDIRPDRQTIMTSATWPEGVRRLARSYLTDPMQVAVGSLDLAAVHTVKQIVEVIDEQEKYDRLLEFIDGMDDADKVLVFAGRKGTVDYLSSQLCLQGNECQSIHGGREQCDREQALGDFKTGAVRILIATDVASRGLDVADISHVFNYDYPRNTEEYVHRVGRTGRAGKSGTSVTLVTRDDWSTAKELIDILTEAQQEVPVELCEMAERFAKMKERRAKEGGFRNRRAMSFRNGRW